MNISLNSLSLVIGSVAGVVTMLAIRQPIMSLIVAVFSMVVTEVILRTQNKS